MIVDKTGGTSESESNHGYRETERAAEGYLLSKRDLDLVYETYGNDKD